MGAGFHILDINASKVIIYIGLGEYKGMDPETGKMMFELEANNLNKQTEAKYFSDGYTESDFVSPPPGFWSNLISGGKLQQEWDLKQEEAIKAEAQKSKKN